MRRARDVREQIEGLMTRVEIEMLSNAEEDIPIRKVYCNEAHHIRVNFETPKWLS